MLDEKLKVRDEWNRKLIAMRDHADADSNNEELLKLKGDRARHESKRIFAETRAYQVTLKRTRALDQEVFNMLKTIRELEDDPALKLDDKSKLDEAMREVTPTTRGYIIDPRSIIPTPLWKATLTDDPGKLKECLDSLGNPHLYRREADRMIQARGELVVRDLKEKIRQCQIGQKEAAGQ